jgi:hypothetical protein
MKEIRPLWRLRQRARERKPGYLEACLAFGKLDPKTGLVAFTPEAWMKIRQQYAMPRKPCNLATLPKKIRPKKTLGVGDAIHKVAGPIGRAINWPCVKDDGTTDLKPGSPCDQMRQAANRIKLPFKAD